MDTTDIIHALTPLEERAMYLLLLPQAVRSTENGDHELANLAHYVYGPRDEHRLTKCWRVLNQLIKRGLVEKDGERYYAHIDNCKKLAGQLMGSPEMMATRSGMIIGHGSLRGAA